MIAERSRGIEPVSAAPMACCGRRQELRTALSGPQKEAKNCVVRSYCVGNIICVKPIVLTVRSIGVSGGSKLGVKKFVSNW